MDVAIAQYECATRAVTCAPFPYRQQILLHLNKLRSTSLSFASGWEWLYGDDETVPVMIQLDGERQIERKFDIQAELGFGFLGVNDTCKTESVLRLQRNAHILLKKHPATMSPGKRDYALLLSIYDFFASLPLLDTILSRNVLWYSVYFD